MEDNCKDCEFYDKEEDRCTAFECWGLGFMEGTPDVVGID